jgi:diguanylate cyclase (GGDEF)-like protein
MFFLTAAVAPLSAATREERRFFRIVAVYLGASLVARFLSSQVGYLWVHAHGNLFCLPAVGVCLAMALFLMQSAWQVSERPAPDRELVMHRLLLRNLMPSLLGFMSLVIALYVFLHAPLVGCFAVLGAILLYLSRTLLLQTHMGREASALRQRNEQLEEISERDPLTGAGNRRSLAARYERAISPGPAWITVLLIDLDFFKQANDLLGHLHGDRILQRVAEVLRGASGSVAGSHVARFGGDEFALLLPKVDSAEAERLAEIVRARVEALALDGGDRPISVSIGGVSMQEADSLDTLIRRADVALYRAKIRGRNCVAFELDQSPRENDPADFAIGSLA